MIRYLLAMPREAEMFMKFADKVPEGAVEVIGINAVDMGEYDKDDILVNVGYAGGYKVPVGELVEPVSVISVSKEPDKAPKFNGIAFTDRVFPLPHYTCFTCDEFVEEPVYEAPAIYDMELFKIAQKPHKRLYAIKIVSDNLCESDCERFNDEDSWRSAVECIAARLRGE